MIDSKVWRYRFRKGKPNCGVCVCAVNLQESLAGLSSSVFFVSRHTQLSGTNGINSLITGSSIVMLLTVRACVCVCVCLPTRANFSQ